MLSIIISRHRRNGFNVKWQMVRSMAFRYAAHLINQKWTRNFLRKLVNLIKPEDLGADSLTSSQHKLFIMPRRPYVSWHLPASLLTTPPSCLLWFTTFLPRGLHESISSLKVFAFSVFLPYVFTCLTSSHYLGLNSNATLSKRPFLTNLSNFNHIITFCFFWDTHH